MAKNWFTATFYGVPYRGSIVRMGGVMMLSVTKAIMATLEPVQGTPSMSSSRTPLARSRFPPS